MFVRAMTPLCANCIRWHQIACVICEEDQLAATGARPSTPSTRASASNGRWGQEKTWPENYWNPETCLSCFSWLWCFAFFWWTNACIVFASHLKLVSEQFSLISWFISCILFITWMWNIEEHGACYDSPLGHRSCDSQTWRSRSCID